MSSAATTPLTIWCNFKLPPDAEQRLLEGVRPHRLIFAQNMSALNLASGAPDPAMNDADIAYGQPDTDSIKTASKLRWVQLSTAGYDRFERPDVRAALQSRGCALTTSSGVYEEPCAEHILALMLSLARQLPQSQDNQRGPRGWPGAERRIGSHLLTGQTVVILSYGSIARRLIELLAPLRMNVIAVRRHPKGDEVVRTIADADVLSVLPRADHVVNILPGGASTVRFMDAAKFAAVKPGCIFYNIGRGGTVDQDALLAALDAGRLRYAYLDVTDPEPLPPSHPLWSHPHCFITPHTAGGAADEFLRQAEHFLQNLRRFERGEPLVNRVI